ncbi:hypothetical protein KIPB_008415 [Kipferlia bialata]|uniref:Uncharacterized protein n=1 Tax=Kipferlia bialata TaxID=797122 RepID=A0A9K3D1H3_9EUKA|nr:hypothetical protein KIPB_008415 [Kipferlia bialata]|eukprot:g8415.t1
MAPEGSVGISLRHAFGLGTNLLGSIQSVDPDTLVFSSGNCLIRHTVSTNQQRIVSVGTRISAMAISPCHKYLSVAEEQTQGTGMGITIV